MRSKINSEDSKKVIRRMAIDHPNSTYDAIWDRMKRAGHNVTFSCVRAVVVHARKSHQMKSVVTLPTLPKEFTPMKTEAKMNMIDMAAFQAVYEETSKHENYLEIVERMAALSLLVGGNENLINWVRFISNKGASGNEG